MITVILGIAIIVVLTRLLIKVILDGADDYSQGIISFSATVFKSIGFTMLDTGLSGAFAVGGLILYGFNMIVQAANPAAYDRYPPLKWLAIIAGILMLLAVVVAIFKSLRCMCVVGLLLVVGVVLLSYFNLLILNVISYARNVLFWLMISGALVVYIVGPLMMVIAGFVYAIIGTIGIWGPVLLTLFVAIAVLIVPYFTKTPNSVVLGIGAVDWRFLGIVLVFFGISLLLEKRPRQDDE